MFVNTTTASRIERAEAYLTRHVAEAVLASGRAPSAFVRGLGDGVASYVRPGSPMNKLIGAGLECPIEQDELAFIEQQLAARGEPTRVELCTLAACDSGTQLTARGYRLLGFENVLVHPLATRKADQKPGIRIEPVTTATQAAWQETTIAAVACSDETGLPIDELSRDLLDEAIADVLEANAFERYLALLGDAVAGAASMLVHDGVALLSGSATLPACRRRGVQAALIGARLESARQRGADLAVVTTAPGSQSQANVMKHGFTLAYARAVLVADPSRA